MIDSCTLSCGVCTPTLPLSQLWDATATYDFGSGSAGYKAELPKAPAPLIWLSGGDTVHDEELHHSGLTSHPDDVNAHKTMQMKAPEKKPLDQVCQLKLDMQVCW
jgi:hypothetical protein